MLYAALMGVDEAVADTELEAGLPADRGATITRGGPSSCTGTHCSYLEIYISQQIKLHVNDLEGQFQTSLQAKSINFLKINIIVCRFSL